MQNNTKRPAIPCLEPHGTISLKFFNGPLDGQTKEIPKNSRMIIYEEPSLNCIWPRIRDFCDLPGEYVARETKYFRSGFYCEERRCIDYTDTVHILRYHWEYMYADTDPFPDNSEFRLRDAMTYIFGCKPIEDINKTVPIGEGLGPANALRTTRGEGA